MSTAPASRQFAAAAAPTWILLLIVAVPQLGLTLINPSNATIAAEFGVPITTVELTLTVYMLGYASSTYVAGTLADRFDAARLQALGLLLFALASVAAAVAPSILVLGIARFIQAFGGTSATVLCRIIVARRYPAHSRISVLASLSMVVSLTPSLSPLVGGVLAMVLPWRALFIILAVFSLALVPVTWWLLGQARPENPALPTISQGMAAIRAALADRGFRYHLTGISLVWMTYFGFISVSSTIMQYHFGQGPVAYGLLMTVPALGYVGGSLVLKRSHDVEQTVVTSVVIGALGMVGTALLAGLFTALNIGMTVDSSSGKAVAVAASTAAEWYGAPLAIVVVLSVTFFGVGATIPYNHAGLLDVRVPFPGVAAGLFFFLQMAAGAGTGWVLGAFVLPTVPALLLALLIPYAVWVWVLLRHMRLARRG